VLFVFMMCSLSLSLSNMINIMMCYNNSLYHLYRGFRRVITTGPDRDTYYHELFLRGKHNLHVKMKRLPTSHRKTPMDKNESSPNFYELSEKSPLPENVWLRQPSVASRGVIPGMTGEMGIGSSSSIMMEGYHHHHAGMMGAAAALPAGMGGGLVTSMNSRMQLMQQQHQQQQHMMGHTMSGMMPGMGMMGAAAPPPFGYPPVNTAAAAAGVGTTGSSPSAPSAVAAAASIRSSDNEITQLQRENDTLMRQLLQLQQQMNPPPNASTNPEDSSTNAAVTALQRDNERLIRQVMELQEQLPPESRMQIPMELLMFQQQQQLQQSQQSRQQQQGKSDEGGGNVEI
jgi:hypothetical protein